MVYVRQDIWALEQQQPWHPITMAYAQAVGALQQRSIANAGDPTGWTYQAAIHGTPTTPAQPGWNQCQHGGWFFLPWHRMYVYRIEAILRVEVLKNGGPHDWALPYWNYDSGGSTNYLPLPFREEALPDGSPNPLYVLQRASGYNAGTRALPRPAVTSPANALAMPTFTPPLFPGFGGGQSTFQHFWNATGGLEQTPHNDVHVQLGGATGWMGNPDFAALDPIFWLHHANIDRLWTVWRAKSANVNPTQNAWLQQQFDLFDTSGAPARTQVKDVLDTVVQLDYRYDDQVPLPPAKLAERGGGDAMAEGVQPAPEMIGASTEQISLSGKPHSVAVAIEQGAHTESLAPEAASPRRLFLSVEHLDADSTPGVVYGVYVEAPGHEPLHVGNVSLFGIHKIRASRAPGGDVHDQRLTYDVTDAVRAFGIDGLAGSSLTVTFAPIEGDAPEAAAEAVSAPPIRIGRVSLFTA